MARGPEGAPGQAGTGRTRQAEETVLQRLQSPAAGLAPKTPAGNPDSVRGAEIRGPTGNTTPSHFNSSTEGTFSVAENSPILNQQT